MAASDPLQTPRKPRPARECLSAHELCERLGEEVGRAERHRTALSCLLVSIEDIDQLSAAHGAELRGQAMAYLGAALERQLRRFDRVGCPAEDELLVVLPGADQRQGEIVARRALGRLHAVKIELDGVRRPLHISVGIAAWRDGLTGEQLLSQARLAAQAGDIGQPPAQSQPSAGFGGRPGEIGGGRPGQAGGGPPESTPLRRS